jgi:hypothetical protein
MKNFEIGKIDNTCETTGNPTYFTGELFVQQRAVLHKMLEMEKKQYLITDDKLTEKRQYLITADKLTEKRQYQVVQTPKKPEGKLRGFAAQIDAVRSNILNNMSPETRQLFDVLADQRQAEVLPPTFILPATSDPAEALKVLRSSAQAGADSRGHTFSQESAQEQIPPDASCAPAATSADELEPVNTFTVKDIRPQEATHKFAAKDAVFRCEDVVKKENAKKAKKDRGKSTKTRRPSRLQTLVEFNAGVLKTPFGSGKTVTIVALVAMEKPPTRRPVMLNIPLKPGSDRYNAFIVDDKNHRVANTQKGGGCWANCPKFGKSDTYGSNLDQLKYNPRRGLTQIPRAEWHPKRNLQQTLVVAASSVLTHWEQTITKFAPQLTYYTISCVKDLNAFVEMVQSGESNEYDIVLIKPGIVKIDNVTSTTLGVLNARLVNFVWDRLVIDDYDTIGMTASTPLPPAFFTWYVSATDRSTSAVSKCATVPWGEIDPAAIGKAVRNVVAGGWPATAASKDRFVNTTLAVVGSVAFCDAQHNIPAPYYVNHVVKGSPLHNIIKNIVVSPEVTEALNSGAVGEAAGLLGFACKTLGELVGRILNQKRKDYQKASEQMKSVQKGRELLRAAPATEHTKPVSNGKVDAFVRDITMYRWSAQSDHPPPAFRDTHWGDKFDTAVELFAAKLREDIVLNGAALERLRENASEGGCQVCLLPWEDDHNTKFVANCCQTVICEVCVTVRGAGGRKRQFLQDCPNCFAKTWPDTDHSSLISLSENIDLEHISDSTVETLAEELETEVVAEKPDEAADDIVQHVWKTFARNDKIRALLQVIRSEPITCVQSVPGKPIDTLLGSNNAHVGDGPGARPQEGDEPKKILVFSYYTESTEEIKKALDMAGANCRLLRGTRNQKDAAIAFFRESVEDVVLVITASKDCSGIHLPEATDAVFYHAIISSQVCAQLAGRGQRPGRKKSLNIHTLLYESE